MSYIKFKTFYTELVEHYFRMAVRHNRVTKESAQDWHAFTQYWIDMQSEEDKKFIPFVFGYQFRNTNDGLHCFDPKETMYAKRERLANLERQFAIDGGLYDESDNTATTA